MKQLSREEALFRTAPVGRAIAALAVPTILSQIITVIYNMADTFFIGQLGDPNQVAAATIGMPPFMILTALANLFGVGGASLISRALGAGDREKAGRGSAFCIWAAACAAIVYSLAMLFLRPVLLPILGADAATEGYASSYLFWTITLGALPSVLNPMLAHLVRAEGHARQASLGVALGGVLNIALDPLFLFVFSMDITGAAIATLLSNCTAMVYFFVFLRRIRGESALRSSPRCVSLRGGIPGEVLSVGLPSCLVSVMAMISNTALNHIIAGYSNEAVAGMGIAKKLNMLAFAIGQGITQGTLPLIGYNYSSGDRARMMRAVRVLLVDCIAVSLAVTAVLYFCAAPFTRCFINNAETVAHGRTFLRIICLACPTSTLIFFAMIVFQATGQRVQPIVLSMLRKGLLDVPLMFLFDHLIGLRGIAWATPAADILALSAAAAMLLPYLKRLQKAGEPKGV